MSVVAVHTWERQRLRPLSGYSRTAVPKRIKAFSFSTGPRLSHGLYPLLAVPQRRRSSTQAGVQRGSGHQRCYENFMSMIFETNVLSNGEVLASL